MPLIEALCRGVKVAGKQEPPASELGAGVFEGRQQVGPQPLALGAGDGDEAQVRTEGKGAARGEPTQPHRLGLEARHQDAFTAGQSVAPTLLQGLRAQIVGAEQGLGCQERCQVLQILMGGVTDGRDGAAPPKARR